MPLAFILAHGLKKIADLRGDRMFCRARPDTKTQVSIEYDYGASHVSQRSYVAICKASFESDHLLELCKH